MKGARVLEDATLDRPLLVSAIAAQSLSCVNLVCTMSPIEFGQLPRHAARVLSRTKPMFNICRESAVCGRWNHSPNKAIFEGFCDTVRDLGRFAERSQARPVVAVSLIW